MNDATTSGPTPPTATVTLRSEQLGDEAFLRQVYASTREEELSLTGWDATTRAAFLDMQFRAMRQGYRSMVPQAEFSVVLLDGKPAGRLVVNRTGDEIRVVDIALLPAYRNRGVGTRLLKGLLAEATERKQPVRLHVVAMSRAVRLYERLGFSALDTQGFHQSMEWRPPG